MTDADDHTTASRDVKAACSKLMRMFAPLLEVHPTITIQLATTFVAVMIEPGKSCKHYAKVARVAPSVSSRHLQDLGEYNRHRKEGLRLVTVTSDPWDRRMRIYHLSTRGKELEARLRLAAALPLSDDQH